MSSPCCACAKPTSKAPAGPTRRRTPSARRRAKKRARSWKSRSPSQGAVKPLPEFGSAEDFPLQQALNHLRGLPVMVSKTARRTLRAEAPGAPGTKQ
jgi:hypothetical protein